MNKTASLICAVVVCLLAPDLDAATGDDLDAIKAQLREAQEQNERLRAHLDQQDDMIETLLARVEELEHEAGAEPVGAEGHSIPRGPAVSRSPQEEEVSEDTSAPPNLFIRGFADTTFYAISDRDELGGAENAFALNELDLLFTSQLSEELSVLSEVVFHFAEIDELSFFEIERIYLKYAPFDVFNVKLGRIHNPIGYWNQTFHHGAWFQTTLTRPEIFKFEDNGGILPIHAIGLEFLGVTHIGSVDFDYSVSASNGRGETIDAIQNVRDLNLSKSLNVRLSVVPTGVPGLRFGATTYFDRFPEVATPDRPGELEEFIAAGHFVYERNRAEFLTELIAMRHREEVSRVEYDSLGFYVQGAYQFRQWKPYYRFDYLELDDEDPIFLPDQRDVRKHTLGTRWDVSTWLALKFEYAFTDFPQITTFHRFATQAAFVF